MNNMDCMFCEEKATVMVEAVNWKLYRAVCGHCGAQGAPHSTPTAAAQEWRRVVQAVAQTEVHDEPAAV